MTHDPKDIDATAVLRKCAAWFTNESRAGIRDYTLAEMAELCEAALSTQPAPTDAGEAAPPAALLAHLRRIPMTEWVWSDAELIFATLEACSQPVTTDAMAEARKKLDPHSTGVIRGVPSEQYADPRISAGQYSEDAITIGLFLGEHSWVEQCFSVEQTIAFIGVLLRKPAITAALSQPFPAHIEALTKCAERFEQEAFEWNAMPAVTHGNRVERARKYAAMCRAALPARPTSPTDAMVEIFCEQTNLVDRLCNAVERSVLDIGGEGSLTVLKLLGPVNDRARACLTAAQPIPSEKRYNQCSRTHIERVERIAAEVEAFFKQGMPGVDIGRIACLAADMMAKELTGETIAATQPSPKVEGKLMDDAIPSPAHIEALRNAGEALKPFVEALLQLEDGRKVWVERPFDGYLTTDHFIAARDAAAAIDAALPAQPAPTDAMVEAASNLLERMSSTFTARNGRQVGIQGDDGEMCWIVHSDDIETLRACLTAAHNLEPKDDPA